jgi:hypothetical protein
MVLGNMLMNAFSGHSGAANAAAASDATGGGAFGQEAVPTSSPWTDPGAAAADQGISQGWGNDGGEKSAWTGGATPDDATGGGYDTDTSDYGTDDAGGGYDDDEA